jgi:hypothetical protein
MGAITIYDGQTRKIIGQTTPLESKIDPCIPSTATTYHSSFSFLSLFFFPQRSVMLRNALSAVTRPALQQSVCVHLAPFKVASCYLFFI